MTNVYTITRHGVYDHGLLGIFTTEAKARECAEKATQDVGYHADGDGYHDFRLDVCPVDGGEADELARWTCVGNFGNGYAWREVKADASPV